MATKWVHKRETEHKKIYRIIAQQKTNLKRGVPKLFTQRGLTNAGLLSLERSGCAHASIKYIQAWASSHVDIFR